MERPFQFFAAFFAGAALYHIMYVFMYGTVTHFDAWEFFSGHQFEVLCWGAFGLVGAAIGYAYHRHEEAMLWYDDWAESHMVDNK